MAAKMLEVVCVEEPKAWCVDLGTTLEPMDDIELWEAIARGDVTAPTRVWRAGMECWTPVEDLPAFAPVLSALASRRA